jgi:4-hydroxy-tetrahydrodipicolinate synthase
MATAKEARDWARHGLRGIGDSLYTPFCGTDGDDIDWEAYRALVRHCIGSLGHECFGAPVVCRSSGH